MRSLWLNLPVNDDVVGSDLAVVQDDETPCLRLLDARLWLKPAADRRATVLLLQPAVKRAHQIPNE